MCSITKIHRGKPDSIIERHSGYSDEHMYERCKVSYGVMTKTHPIKVGRGKKAVTLQKRVFPVDVVAEKRIVESLKYYKNRMENPRKIKFRDYQNKIISSGSEILLKHGFLYLTMEVRTGKTLTSLGIASIMKSSRVLFVTKKKAISSIEKDYDLLNPEFDIQVINYESLHKVEDFSFDVLILDEAHSMGAFPKPSKRAKQVRDIVSKYNPYVILLSGTPTPESYSQMYHQVYGIQNNPFNECINFYKFAKRYVNVKQRKINGLFINDYHDGLKSIVDDMKPYIISFSQKEAGFKVDTKEHILEVDMDPMTYKLTSKLKKDLVIEGKDEVILADTPVKLMMKLHQLYSGTVKFESGNSTIIDTSKAEYIYDNFCLQKIGIFYKFKEELNALKEVYGDQLCTELEEFENTDKTIALQIVSGREGISLKQAKALVYYNIDFSATSYWQSRDRMTTKERLESDVYWIFSKGGIEKDIYKAVSKKKDYTVSHFKKDLLTLNKI